MTSTMPGAQVMFTAIAYRNDAIQEPIYVVNCKHCNLLHKVPLLLITFWPSLHGNYKFTEMH